MDAGGEVDFLIIGSSPMEEPGLIFGNPRPSRRVLKKGDFILNELAAGYNGYTAQIGVPICVGEPTEQIRRMFDEIVLPGFKLAAAELMPGRTLSDIHRAGRFFREHGYQSRPMLMHGMDLVSHPPSVTIEGYAGEDFGYVLKPGRVMMLEPNPITMDGRLGLFFGHTYLITEDGQKRVTDRLPLELIVV
jgi:Xaa-Pro aminopeptidase